MKNNIETAASDRKSRTYRLAMTAVMTAVICILAPFSIPIGPVPVSLANLAIFLSVYLLGWKAGDFYYDPTPAYFNNAEEVDQLIYNSFCGANLRPPAERRGGYVRTARVLRTK